MIPRSYNKNLIAIGCRRRWFKSSRHDHDFDEISGVLQWTTTLISAGAFWHFFGRFFVAFFFGFIDPICPSVAELHIVHSTLP